MSHSWYQKEVWMKTTCDCWFLLLFRCLLVEHENVHFSRGSWWIGGFLFAFSVHMLFLLLSSHLPSLHSLLHVSTILPLLFYMLVFPPFLLVSDFFSHPSPSTVLLSLQPFILIFCCSSSVCPCLFTYSTSLHFSNLWHLHLYFPYCNTPPFLFAKFIHLFLHHSPSISSLFGC